MENIERKYPKWVDNMLSENGNVYISTKMYKRYIGNIKKLWNIIKEKYVPVDPNEARTFDGYVLTTNGRKN